MKGNIQIRIDAGMKEEFLCICESQGKIPSKVLRSMIESYVMANTEMSLQNNICDDSASIITTNDNKELFTAKNGQRFANVALDVIRIQDNKRVKSYKKNTAISKSYWNKAVFKYINRSDET